MEIQIDTRITFTPAAHAVLRGAKMILTPNHRLKILGLAGDLIELDGCQATFVIAARKWSVSPTAETLELMLDLATKQTSLNVVK